MTVSQNDSYKKIFLQNSQVCNVQLNVYTIMLTNVHTLKKAVKFLIKSCKSLNTLMLINYAKLLHTV